MRGRHNLALSGFGMFCSLTALVCKIWHQRPWRGFLLAFLPSPTSNQLNATPTYEECPPERRYLDSQALRSFYLIQSYLAISQTGGGEVLFLVDKPFATE